MKQPVVNRSDVSLQLFTHSVRKKHRLDETYLLYLK